MRIAVDAMGGDHAPAEIVAGTVQAARAFDHISKMFLVGQEAALRAELARHGDISSKIEIRHCTEVVEMGDSPAVAVRRKKDASINRAVDMVKAGEAEAVFSAGSTGAQVASSLLKLRMLEGVVRPAIATVFPSPVKPFVLLDAGATTDCTSEMLLQFAVMGSVYAREIMGVASPRIGLMSVGEEDSKGNAVTKEAFSLISKAGLNFGGNCEGHDLFEGHLDVIVCDGFVGNVILKTSESVAHAVGTLLKQSIKTSLIRQLGALMMKGVFADLKRELDPAAYGGAPLLGVNGVSIIGHGSSKALAVYNGIRASAEAVRHDINHAIVEGLKKAGSAL